MRRPIMTSAAFLSQPSAPATKNDAKVAQDLLDTLAAHANECVGMAANMIGVSRQVIVFDDNGTARAMFNPRITAQSEPYETREGCLSLIGERKTTRYRRITVSFDDLAFHRCTENFAGWTAQIIQHEIDHCNGIVI
ncbi:peptide deformylase [Bifidobacterium callimiconis]|uniref:Peptide deformylase n=1 Tax=Bifidobacterium callimiconis TaxID=2306973 RepID=A0A430F9B4_9BIFI|nr:peptide deformylase [Bifidobacterium callimiconis]MBT1178003.1 peptide deformylase [Bifidobacterium callimiconis]RSX49422.1 peptide deformylase [Bifidobacterium callimiconis]